MKIKPVFVYKGEGLARYNFGESHPFGPERHDAFHDELANLSVENMIQIGGETYVENALSPHRKKAGSA